MRAQLVAMIVAAGVLLSCLCPSVEAAPPRVAVLDFSNTTKDANVEWLGPAVAETLTTKLHAVRSLRLVERLQLYRVVQEQKLSLSDLVDPGQAAKVGRILGADQIVLGAFTIFGGTVRFTTRFVDVTSAAILATSSVNGSVDPNNPSAFWSALDSLADATISSLNQTSSVASPAGRPPADARIEPTPEERSKLRRQPATSLSAMEALGNGLSAFREHRWPDAARHLETATRLDGDLAEAWLYLGETFQKVGRYSEALAASERSLRLHEARSDDNGQSHALNVIGLIYLNQSRYPDAQHHFELSLRRGERANDVTKTVDALLGLGEVAAAQGRHDSALAFFERSLRTSETNAYTLGTIRSLADLGYVRARQRRLDDALGLIEQSFALSEQIGHLPAMTTNLTSLGAIYSQKGDLAKSLEYHEKSMALVKKIGDEPSLPGLHLNIGRVYERDKRYVEALRSYDSGREIAQRLGDERMLAELLASIGSTRIQMKHHADALEPLERALAIAQRIKLPDDRISAFRKLRDMAQRCLKPRLFGC